MGSLLFRNDIGSIKNDSERGLRIMKKLFYVLIGCLLLVALTGCGTTRPMILTETGQYYFIPAGTPFTAVVYKDEPPVEVTRTKPSWVVDAGYLATLQEEANAIVLELKDPE